jgi:hypothetical protein
MAAVAGLLLGALGGCEKDPKRQDPPVPLESLPLLAMVELPSGRDLGPLGGMLDLIQPGAGAMATFGLASALPGLVGLDSLDGADLGGPVRIAAVEAAGAVGPVLIVKVASRGTLEKNAKAAGAKMVIEGGLAVLGEPGPVEAAAGVLSAVAAMPAPTSPSATIFVPRALSALGPDLRAARADVVAAVRAEQEGEEMIRFVEAGFDLLLAMAEQTQRIELAVAAPGDLAGFEVRLLHRPGTTFEQMSRLQAPADHALVSRLPAQDQVGILVSGRMLLGPLRQPAFAMGERMMGGDWTEVLAETRDEWDAWMDLFTGEFAMTAPSFGVTPDSAAPTVELAYLVGVTDGPKVVSFFRRFSQLVAERSARGGGTTTMGIVQTSQFQPGAYVHDGIAVDVQRTTSDYRSVEGESGAALRRFGVVTQTSHVAAIDSLLAMSIGEEARMRALLDAARGKGPTLELGPILAAAVAGSKARKESALMAMDMRALAGPMAGQMPISAVVLGLGFDQAGARVFVGVAR